MARQGAQRVGRLGRFHRLQDTQAILTYRLGIRLASSLRLGETGVLKPLPVAVVPRRGRPLSQPLGGSRSQLVEGRTERLHDECEAVEHADGSEHMRGVGALRPTRWGPGRLPGSPGGAFPTVLWQNSV